MNSNRIEYPITIIIIGCYRFKHYNIELDNFPMQTTIGQKSIENNLHN